MSWLCRRDRNDRKAEVNLMAIPNREIRRVFREQVQRWYLWENVQGLEKVV